MTVAVLGVGTMGFGMAQSLLRAGFDLTVWNRSRDKAQPLGAEGATVAGSVAEAVQGADIVVTMLFDADAVLAVMHEAQPHLEADALWLQTSTVGLGGAARVADFARRHAIDVLDTPVLGTRQPAAQGALVVLASGDPSLRRRADSVFEAVGTKTVWAGDQVGRASALKLACNAWVATVNAGVAQSIALAGGLGLDPQLFLDAIAGGATDTPYAHVKGAAMLQRAYPPSFALDGVVKDVGLMLDAAGRTQVDATVLTALHAAYSAASAAGHGGEDMAAVYEALRAGGVGHGPEDAGQAP